MGNARHSGEGEQKANTAVAPLCPPGISDSTRTKSINGMISKEMKSEITV